MPRMELPPEIQEIIKSSPHSSGRSSTNDSDSETSADDSDSGSSAPLPSAAEPTSAAERASTSAVSATQPESGASDGNADADSLLDDIKVVSDITDPGEITVAAVKDVLMQMEGKNKSHNTTVMLDMPVLRAAKLAAVWAGRRIIWERPDNVEAILIQCVGVECQTPCQRCSLNLGPFEGCYSVAGVNPSCGNCKYNSQGHRCTNHPKNIGKPPPPRSKNKLWRSTDGNASKKRKTVHTPAPAAAPGSSGTASSHAASSRPARLAPPVAGSSTSGGAVRALQVPVPAGLGWEDAMTLRRVLHEISEQFIFQPQDTRHLRRLLRDFSGALEDYASEMQE